MASRDAISSMQAFEAHRQNTLMLQQRLLFGIGGSVAHPAQS
jgi:hypothetical protein